MCLWVVSNDRASTQETTEEQDCQHNKAKYVPFGFVAVGFSVVSNIY